MNFSESVDQANEITKALPMSQVAPHFSLAVAFLQMN